MELASKKCVPCEGGAKPLTQEQAEQLLMQIPECGWHLVQEGGLRIQTHLKFKNFKKALEFVNELGELAEQEGHHPDISIHDWNQVEVSFHTHAINGLHENDFIMAAKVNELIHQQS